jgi:hypothetical protein
MAEYLVDQVLGQHRELPHAAQRLCLRGGRADRDQAQPVRVRNVQGGGPE